ncbi:hypothetical protein [Candidatus Neptunichlamydia sp. REUL1]|uniref:hypothetical protein n=1 Tax=Candidatus Neptunichlamydia sp. REUL1 TaxID=3064277 RepID=UPI00292CD1CA|nr:hypothetical protein [Candidatus Neptunochlamydia sp. REUL1]
MQCVSAKEKIYCDRDKLFSFFWDIEKWSSFWSPIHNISVFYDDRLNQDFYMSVDWQDGAHSIRTVRFQVDGNIHFFSPLPPPPTKSHQGKWEFVEANKGIIEVMASRLFELPSNWDNSKTQIFLESFTDRLKQILREVKTACEN